MSQLDGFFSLRTPKDLLEKLKADFDRLRGASPVSVDAQYAAFDFFVTTEHLVDWLRHATGRSKTSLRNYHDAPLGPIGALVSHIANGAKHFRVNTNRHTTAKDSRAASGAFDPEVFDPAVFDTPRLVIHLENGKTVEVLDLAERVLDHWQKTIT